jgi:hypothetical protein
MAQMSTVRQVKTHEPVMRPHDCLVNLQVGGATAQALDIDTPLLRVEAECCESTRLAQKLDGVNVLVSAVVAGTGVALGVLVGHGRAERVKYSAGGNILRGDEENGLALTLDFLLLRSRLEVSHTPFESELTMIWATSLSVSTKDFSMSCHESIPCICSL